MGLALHYQALEHQQEELQNSDCSLENIWKDWSLINCLDSVPSFTHGFLLYLLSASQASSFS